MTRKSDNRHHTTLAKEKYHISTGFYSMETRRYHQTWCYIYIYIYIPNPIETEFCLTGIIPGAWVTRNRAIWHWNVDMFCYGLA